MNYFVTGTDTGAGKTRFTRLLVEALRAEGIDAAGFKPVCCGDRDDAVELAAASGGLEPAQVNPVWLKAPVAPLVAGMLENRPIDTAALLMATRDFIASHAQVIVEGVGGWRVPLAEGYDMADFAVDLGLPVIIVVGNRLGALNHTILTVDAIRARGVEIAGLVMNHLEDELDTAAITNKGMIEQLTGVPILAEIIHGQDFFDAEPFIGS
ncbi:dethiobiotin synthase [Luteolibacter flavescens]|uniref:ATP-dependent dethiobiotin synthetase BioD n=1 Tax=Luteolibacter flavescens TaxID=1859460 RepID=A0ABT3FQL8_9BACT|nr:dethiobiotin synthase [Luteolibacter flavescens]MCW1885757.1 dethiobiotin synthase [Luteolibacter flavescens]